MLCDALRQRRVKLIPIETVYTQIDEFMTSGNKERPWQVFELTQSQNVEEWINSPDKIETIQANLNDFASILKKNKKSAKILDVGCYGGYLYDYLSKYVYKNKSSFSYTGVDIQEKAIESARNIHANCGNCIFNLGDIYDLNNMYDIELFDFVFCSRVLIHIPYIEKAIANLLHVAKSAVVLVLRLEDNPSCTKYLEKDLDDGHEVTYFVRTVSTKMIANMSINLKFKYRIINNNSYYSSIIIDKTNNLEHISSSWLGKIPLLSRFYHNR